MRLITLSMVAFTSLAPLASALGNEQSTTDATTEESIIPQDFASESNEELIVAVLYRKQEPLSDGMLAYAIGGDIALPLEQLMFLVEFPIKVSPDAQSASGWFIRENRLFSLDLNKGIVTSNGKQFPISQSQVRIEDGELYVPTKLLSEWFPLTIKSNLRALDVTIIPKESTAIDERIERKQRAFGSVYQVYAKNPEHHTPYKALTIPSVSASFGVGFNNSQDVGNTGDAAIRAYGDLAYMAAELALIANQDEITDARLTLSRRNPRGGLLGYLDATEVELGDISGSSLPLISGNTSGRGARIARQPAGYVGNQETVTIDGILETNYSVELYRNNILINANQSGTGTRYEFKDLELLAGQNEFRLEFYGPQGQRRTEIKRFYMGANLLKKGEINYDVSLSQPGKTLFDVGLNTSEHEELSVSARLDYGVSRNLTISGGLASTPIASGQKVLNYGFVGASTQFSGIYGNFDLATDEKGGTAWSVQASTQLSKVSLSAKYVQYHNGFISNKTLNSDGRQISSSVNLSATSNPMRVGKNLYFNVGIRASQNTFTDQEWSRQFNLDVSSQFKNLMVANSLDYNQYSGSSEDSLTGQMRLNSRVGKLQLRLNGNYTLEPENKLQQFEAGVTYPLAKGFSASADFKEDYEADSKSISASLSKQFRFATVGLSATRTMRADEKDDTTFYLTTSFSTFTDPKSRKTQFRNSLGASGASRVTTFFDENRDGIYNPGETTIPDINIGGYSNTRGKTDAAGEALITTSFFGDWTDLKIDSASLPTADLMPGNAGVSVLNRPGVVTNVHLPLIRTGGVEGHITLSRADKSSTPLSNIEIQALQKHPLTGELNVVATSYSAYDGFYSIADIPLGSTQLRINPEQLGRLAVKNQPTHTISLDKDNNFIENQNFRLNR